jgi:hypothetical protein
MIGYQPPVYRPRLSQAVIVPAAATPVVSTPVAPGFPEGIFWTAIAGAAAWAAISTARQTTGFKSVAAWAGGIGAGLAALTGLTGILAPSVSRSLPLRWYF